MINVLAKERVVLELLQQDLTVPRLLQIMENSLNNPEKTQQTQNIIFNIIKPLAVKNAYKNTSFYIANY